MRLKLGVIVFSLLIVLTVVVVVAVYFLSKPQSSTDVRRTPRILASFHTNDTGALALKGIVQNNFTVNIRSVNVTGRIFDAKGRQVASSTVRVFSDILKPEEKAPFEISYDLPSGIALAEYSINGSSFETDSQPRSGIVLSDVSSVLVSEGFYVTTGGAQNSAAEKAYQASVFGAYFDSEGNLVWMSRGSVSTVLEPSEHADFVLSSSPHRFSEAPGSLELLPYVYSYAPEFNMNYVLLALLIAVFVVVVLYMKRRGW